MVTKLSRQYKEHRASGRYQEAYDMLNLHEEDLIGRVGLLNVTGFAEELRSVGMEKEAINLFTVVCSMHLLGYAKA